jgi:hypothetical protein
MILPLAYEPPVMAQDATPVAVYQTVAAAQNPFAPGVYGGQQAQNPYPQPSYAQPPFAQPQYPAPGSYAQPAPQYPAPTYVQPSYAQPSYPAPQPYAGQGQYAAPYQQPAVAPASPFPNATYRQPAATQRPAVPAYPQSAYPQSAYPAQPAYPQQGYAPPQPAYRQPAHNGYAAPQPNYGQPPAYTPPSYPPQGYAQPGYPQNYSNPYPAQTYPQQPQTYPQPGYQQPGYAQPSYPAPAYQAPGYQAPAYQAPTPYAAPQANAPSTYPMPAPVTPYAGQPGWNGQGNGGYTGSGDPEMDRINAEIAALSDTSTARVDTAVNFRNRSGEQGLSTLEEIGATVGISTGIGPGRVELSVSPTSLDAGVPTDRGLSRFGKNPIKEAEAVVGKYAPVLQPAKAQRESGVAVKLSYETSNFALDIGTTPIGIGGADFQGGVRWSPKPTPETEVRMWLERRPVTDSFVSYAGTNDPQTNAFWGRVKKTGGGVSFSYDKGEGAGFYVDAAYYRYDGVNVPNNSSIQTNVGGYLAAWRNDTSSLTAGVNVNYQRYDNNQNYFSYGHGGYFSPQSYISVGFPVRYKVNSGPLNVDLSVSPGYQTYRQDEARVFPNEPGLQGTLDSLKARDNTVLARYLERDESGFGIALQGAAWYRLNSGTSIGGDLRLNTFGDYSEAQAMVRLRQSLGGETR